MSLGNLILRTPVPPLPFDDPARTDRLCLALAKLQTALLIFDAGLGVLFVSDGLEAMLGLPRGAAAKGPERVGSLLRGALKLSPALAAQVEQACQEVVADGSGGPVAVTLAAGSDGRVLGLQLFRLDDGGWMAVFEDATARQAPGTDAVTAAMSDPLTGLANRQLFKQKAEAALAGYARRMAPGGPAPAAAAPLMLILMDLDRFKAVNDALGHAIGDGLLRLVAGRLRAMLRANDVVARLGGDEFALLIRSAPDRDSVARLAKRIVEVLGRAYLIDGHLVNIGTSLGIAVAPTDGTEHDLLLRSADLALYHAKNNGRGTFSFFTPEMDARALARRALEIDLRKALALGEFELFYQPQIDLETGTVDGFEALLRWQHPERGMVSPGDFIPLAEEIGMIVPMGDWVIREACMQAAKWPESVSVAVNVSPHQFGDTARLVGTVKRALTASGLAGERLEIEITESVLLRNEGTVLAALHQLRDLGVRIAMDDFGTGYSSLSQLHSFPFDKIKIDRSFVKDRGDKTGQNAIIRAITALGVSLGMSTIAEGVETSEQLERIRTEGCTSVQGYLFSRPVPVGQVEALIARGATAGAP